MPIPSLPIIRQRRPAASPACRHPVVPVGVDGAREAIRLRRRTAVVVIVVVVVVVVEEMRKGARSCGLV
jgi:hypothetical protein